MKRPKPAPAKQALIIMAKPPKAGLVKTRLAASLGSTAATRFYRHLSRRLISQLSHDPRWQTFLAITPDAALTPPHPWGGLIAPGQLLPQGPGSLGEKMQRLFTHFAPTPTLIIGTDIPGITAAHIEAAFQTLQQHQVIFGPSGDGGYWCVGQRNRPRCLPLFNSVRWSSANTLKDSTAGLNALIGYTTSLSDVDTGDDLAALPPSLLNRWVI